MNIICVICSDLFIPTAAVYITQCGHMFHYVCLLSWIKRSKTCPQCRCKCTENTIHRVYFTLAAENSGDEGTLINKLKNFAGKEQIVALRRAIHALKAQVSFFNSQPRDGTREQGDEMSKFENNIESLAILATALKKPLLEGEPEKQDMEYSLKKAQNELTKYRGKINESKCQNDKLRKELEFTRNNLITENEYLVNKITELNNKISSGNSDITNTSLDRSPVNFNRRPQLSPSEEKLKKSIQPVSHCLPMKSTNTALDCTSILNAKTKIESEDSVKCHNFDDIVSSLITARTGFKRPKSPDTVSSNKFNKLGPGPAKYSQYYFGQNS